MISDMAAAIVWSGIQVSIFALIIAATVLAIRKWLGGLVRELLTASLALIILVSLLPMLPVLPLPSVSLPDYSLIPNWFAVAESSPDKEPVEVNDFQSSATSSFERESIASPAETIPSESAIASDDGDVSAQWRESVAVLWARLEQTPVAIEAEERATEPAVTALATSQTRFTWLNLLFAMILVSVVIGLIRLVIGVFAISKLKRTSVATTDPLVLREVDRLCDRLAIRKEVEVLTTNALTTPATIGWAKPVILLPENFDSWSESEISSAIAHELAHVSSNDFGMNLVAQLAVALNFYNPLVHYLAKELRVAQELAADALAASTTGGRKNYLLTMAEMALQQESRQSRQLRQLGWLAQPFLPTRKTFLRRIEMLKSDRKLRGMRSVPAIWLARMTILVFAIGCVGLKIPAAESAVTQGESSSKRSLTVAETATEATSEQGVATASVTEQETVGQVAENSGSEEVVTAGVRVSVDSKTESMAFNKLAYVANKTQFFAAIDFENLIIGNQDPAFNMLKKLSSGISKSSGLGKLSIDMEKLIAATVQAYDVESRELSGGLVLHSREMLPEKMPDDPEFLGGKFTYRGQACLEMKDGICLHIVPQSATMLMATNRDNLTTMLDSKHGPTVDGWKDVNPGLFKRPVVVAASELGFEFIRSISGISHELKMFSSLWKDSRCAIAGLNLVDGQLRLEAFGIGNDEAAAKSVAETVTALKVVLKNSVFAEKDPAFVVGDQTEQVHRIIKESINNISVSHYGANRISMTTSACADKKLVAQILETIVSDVAPVGYHVDNLNNLRRIALAMHNYESNNLRFPSGGLIRDRKLGEAPQFSHSWRIAILPYIEENEIYNRYRFDQPWDSPHNSKVTARMPDVFRHPSQPRDTTSASYYVVVGEETMFRPDSRAVTFGNVLDGTSNTIMVVEAKRDVHWAKPEDIQYDPMTLKDQLGGFTPDKFGVAVADGSVRTLSKNLNSQVLSWLFEIADGNVVQFNGAVTERSQRLNRFQDFQPPSSRSRAQRHAPDAG